MADKPSEDALLMWMKFCMRTSAPRLIKKKREAEKRQQEQQKKNDDDSNTSRS